MFRRALPARAIAAGVAVACSFLLAAPAHAGPVAATVRSMCMPWIAGAPANTLADAATRAGLKPKWVGNTLESITLPPRAMFGAPSFVQLHGDRLGCAFSGTYTDARVLGLVLQDIETLAVPGAAGSVRFAKASDNIAAGKRTIVYAASGIEIVVADMPDMMLSDLVPGTRSFEVRVRSKRPAVKVAGPPAAGPKGPTHMDDQGCAYKPGSGRIGIVATRQKYTPAGDYDGPIMVLRDGQTVSAEQAGYTFATGRGWYTANAPIIFKGRRYVKADPKVATAKVISPTDLTLVGEFDTVPLAQERVSPNATPSPAAASILWVLYPRLRCEFQPYVPVR